MFPQKKKSESSTLADQSAWFKNYDKWYIGFPSEFKYQIPNDGSSGSAIHRNLTDWAHDNTADPCLPPQRRGQCWNFRVFPVAQNWILVVVTSLRCGGQPQSDTFPEARVVRKTNFKWRAYKDSQLVRIEPRSRPLRRQLVRGTFTKSWLHFAHRITSPQSHLKWTPPNKRAQRPLSRPMQQEN